MHLSSDSDMLSVVPENTDLPERDNALAVRYGFRVGGLGFLVPEGIITEVLDSAVVFPLPRSPGWLAGMINMRGNVVPLFNPLELPGLGESASHPDRIIVLGQAAHAVAVYINGLPIPLDVKASVNSVRQLPGVLQDFTEFAFYDKDTHWYEFNYTEFFQHLASGNVDAVEICG